VVADAGRRSRRYRRLVRTRRRSAARSRGSFPPRLDLFLGLAVTAGLLAWTWAVNGTKPSSAVATLLVLAMGAAIWWRRRAPVATGLALAVAAVAYELGVRQAGAVLVAPLLIAFYTIGAYAPPRRAAVGLGLTYAVTLLSFLDQGGSIEDWLGNALFIALIAGGVWGGGVAARISRGRAAELAELAAQLEREREEKARLAVAAERARIARELHDVVAHGISVIAVQAGSGRHTLKADPERAHEAFGAIESTARQALVEMRRLLGLLREGNEPVTAAPLPGMDSYPQLIEQARAAGLSVSLDVEGQPHALPAGIDLAAYRILQEALTNVRKHAPGGRAAVRLRYGARDFEVEVRDDGAHLGARGPGVQGGGQGLIGMRERVALYRGELHAGPLPNGGFRVHARLPLDENSA
jgi:signal transduction histidine kinase